MIMRRIEVVKIIVNEKSDIKEGVKVKKNEKVRKCNLSY